MHPYRPTASGVQLFVRVTPNASHNEIVGIEKRDTDQTILRVKVSAVPDKGKANKAVVALLAKKLRLSKSALTITAGQTARLKTLAIDGAPDRIIKALETLLDQSN